MNVVPHDQGTYKIVYMVNTKNQYAGRKSWFKFSL